MDRIPISLARAELTDLVGRVHHAGDRIAITRHGKVVAVLVPEADLEYLEELELELDSRDAEAAKKEPTLSFEEAMAMWGLDPKKVEMGKALLVAD